MQVQDVDLRLLRIFVTIVECGGLSAAEICIETKATNPPAGCTAACATWPQGWSGSRASNTSWPACSVVLLVKMRMVSVAKLREIRPYVIVGAFVVAAVVTPPDVISQIMLAVPLWMLYEVGIIVSTFIEKPRQETSAV